MWIAALVDQIEYDEKENENKVEDEDDEEEEEIYYDADGNAAISVEEMRAHIERLVAQYDIFHDTRWVKRTYDAYAVRERDGAGYDEIQTPPIKGEITYAMALHEIGHIRGRYQIAGRQ